MSTNLRSESEYYRIALAMDLMNTTDVVGWADDLMRTLEDQAPDEIIDVAMAAEADRVDLINLLNSIPGEDEESDEDHDEAAHRALALLQEQIVAGGIEFEELAAKLNTYCEYADLDDGEYDDVMELSDSIALAEQGLGETIESVEKDVQRYLGRVAKCG